MLRERSGLPTGVYPLGRFAKKIGESAVPGGIRLGLTCVECGHGS
jgi:hypothetical protein